MRSCLMKHRSVTRNGKTRARCENVRVKFVFAQEHVFLIKQKPSGGEINTCATKKTKIFVLLVNMFVRLRCAGVCWKSAGTIFYRTSGKKINLKFNRIMKLYEDIIRTYLIVNKTYFKSDYQSLVPKPEPRAYYNCCTVTKLFKLASSMN